MKTHRGQAFSLLVALASFYLSPTLKAQEARTAAQPPQAAADQHKEAEKEAIPVPPERPVATHHEMTLDGKTLKYTATAGNLIIRDEDEKPYACSKAGMMALTRCTS